MSGSVIGAMFAAFVLTMVAFAHPIGPGLMLGAITPFDAIPFALFGTAGNLITYVPIVIFLIRLNPGYWGQAFLGTRIQQLAAFFVVALLASHAVMVVEQGLDQIFEWLRKVTLFLLMGVFAWSLRDPKHLVLFVRVSVTSMAIFVAFSALDFYFGIQIMPVKAGRLETAALDTQFETYLATNWRFTGPGFPVNRFSNYLLLVIFLGVGWVMSTKTTLERAFAAGFTGVLIIGELLTVTRSGILGMVVGFVVLLPLGFRFRVAQVVGLALVGGAIGIVGYYVLGLTSGDEVIAQRFEFSHLIDSTIGRFERIHAALAIWSQSPFVGSGWNSFHSYSWKYISGGGLGAHNGYMNVLAECGLLGFIPLMVLTVTVVRRSLVSVRGASEAHEFWRVYFLCGLIAQFVTNVFNDYLWERYLWLCFAFCVVLEHLYHAEQSKKARERLEHLRSLGPPAFAAGAGSPGRG